MSADGTAPLSPVVSAAPFLKWAGGKRALCETIVRYLPEDMSVRTYFEPFLGGGALFFWLRANRPARDYVLSDVNEDLMLAYRMVQSACLELRFHLQVLEEVRSLSADHQEQFERERRSFNLGLDLMPAHRAARFIYLNRTCFNGLWRTNRKGEFNVPFGRFSKPPALNDERVTRAHRALCGARLLDGDVSIVSSLIKRNDVVYLDPPYVPAGSTANFTGYSGVFGDEEQRILAALVRSLSARGVWVVASNSDTPRTRELYAGLRMVEVEARRSVSAKSASRGSARELLILGEAVAA